MNVLSCPSVSLSPCAIFHLGLLFAMFGDFIFLTNIVILLTPPFYRSSIKMLSRKDLSTVGLHPLGKPAIYYYLLFPIFNLFLINAKTFPLISRQLNFSNSLSNLVKCLLEIQANYIDQISPAHVPVNSFKELQ